jgi:hypothetical protein
MIVDFPVPASPASQKIDMDDEGDDESASQESIELRTSSRVFSRQPFGESRELHRAEDTGFRSLSVSSRWKNRCKTSSPIYVDDAPVSATVSRVWVVARAVWVVVRIALAVEKMSLVVVRMVLEVVSVVSVVVRTVLRAFWMRNCD